MTFAELGTGPTLVAALRRAGIEEPFPIQTMTIPDGLAGRDVCGRAQTGSGKTIAFAIPLVQRIERDPAGAPRGLVLVPTRELAIQVAQVIQPLARAAGVRVAALYGGVSFDRQRADAAKGMDVVVATPGRLIDFIERKQLSLDRLQVAVVDEADRMADYGFLPQVEWVLRSMGQARPQVLLFSATLDGQVKGLIDRYLHDPVHHDVVNECATVEQMVHVFLAVHQMDRVRVAAAICRGVSRTLLFVRTKRGADRLFRELQSENIKVGAIHGDLRQPARERALQDFTSGKLQALVATDVAARGIHVDDVDVVLQFDTPEDEKAYVHRAGRTARAGQEGIVATFVLWNDEAAVSRIQRRLGLSAPVVEVFSNDRRLADLASVPAGASMAS